MRPGSGAAVEAGPGAEVGVWPGAGDETLSGTTATIATEMAMDISCGGRKDFIASEPNKENTLNSSILKHTIVHS